MASVPRVRWPKLERLQRAVETASLREVRASSPRTRVDIVPAEGGGFRFALRTETGPPVPTGDEPVLRPMPRRAQAAAEFVADLGPPPLRRGGVREASLRETLARLYVWLSALTYFAGGTVWDTLRSRDSEERRAVRLRRMFENGGGTFVKIGQQMSIRLDLLPARYCHELGKMLDSVPPFPTEQAIATIERATGRPLSATFAQFDPQPIGSASIACVYQAVLRGTGEKVAVKVRRPRIERLFAADFRVLDWLMGLPKC
jgi:hypothetical protein